MKYKPATGLRKLTQEQVEKLDDLIFELSEISKKTGQRAKLTITFIKGHPRILEKIIGGIFDGH